MLQKNPLCPPRPVAPGNAGSPSGRPAHRPRALVSAEDFDTTGVLAGLDPCESRYWWMPGFGSSIDAAADRHPTPDLAG